MNSAVIRYVEGIYKTARKSAEEYKEVQNAPFEVDEREVRFRKERYIRWSWCLWGAIEALRLTDDKTYELYKKYKERIERLDEIAYYNE